MSIERLGLPYIYPTLREDRGEIEAAQAGPVARRRRTGRYSVLDLHMHTTWSDGTLSVLDMARAAQAVGHDRLRHYRSFGQPRALPTDFRLSGCGSRRRSTRR